MPAVPPARLFLQAVLANDSAAIEALRNRRRDRKIGPRVADNSYSPLHHAVLTNDPKVVSKILARADAYRLDQQSHPMKLTALALACSIDGIRAEIITEIVVKAPDLVRVCDVDEQIPISIAIAKQRDDILEIFMKRSTFGHLYNITSIFCNPNNVVAFLSSATTFAILGCRISHCEDCAFGVFLRSFEHFFPSRKENLPLLLTRIKELSKPMISHHYNLRISKLLVAVLFKFGIVESEGLYSTLFGPNYGQSPWKDKPSRDPFFFYPPASIAAIFNDYSVTVLEKERVQRLTEDLLPFEARKEKNKVHTLFELAGMVLKASVGAAAQKEMDYSYNLLNLELPINTLAKLTGFPIEDVKDFRTLVLEK